MADQAEGEKTKLNIRRMRSSDIEQVFALEQITFPTPWSLKSFEFELNNNPASRQWVIEAEETSGELRIVAYSVCWILGDEVHIANFAVATEYRQRGLGRRLLGHILHAALEDGMQSATLEVRAGNLAAKTLYAAYGFREVGLRKHYYSDNGEDALLLQLPNLRSAWATWPPQANRSA